MKKKILMVFAIEICFTQGKFNGEIHKKILTLCVISSLTKKLLTSKYICLIKFITSLRLQQLTVSEAKTDHKRNTM